MIDIHTFDCECCDKQFSPEEAVFEVVYYHGGGAELVCRDCVEDECRDDQVYPCVVGTFRA